MSTSIRWEEYSRVVFLTGAGISVASGLRPYRGPGGIWNEVEVMDYASADAIRERPAEVWRFLARARAAVQAAAPNPAHLALARLEERLAAGGRSFTLITQNVDGLHQRAGSRNVVELHGALGRSCCTNSVFSQRSLQREDRTPRNSRCPLPPFADDSVDERCPPCPRCGAPLRADVVLFDELLPVAAERAAKHALRDCDLFVAVGTSGTVMPAASFVRWAEYAGARTVLVNLEPMERGGSGFHDELLGRAEELLPALVGE